MEAALKEKLETVVELVRNLMVDPDIDVEYVMPDGNTMDGSIEVDDPYFLVKYSENKYVTRKIRLTKRYVQGSAEEIANLITFSIEQFKEEIDSVQMG
jgi:hypothetical protein